MHYRPDLPANQLAQLRAYVTDPASGHVVGGSVTQPTRSDQAVNAYETAVCDIFDIDGLGHFVGAWFDDSRAKPVE